MERRTTPTQTPAERRAAEREARLAGALRANLRRRKAQSRARQEDAVAGKDAAAETSTGDGAPAEPKDAESGDRT